MACVLLHLLLSRLLRLLCLLLRRPMRLLCLLLSRLMRLLCLLLNRQFLHSETLLYKRRLGGLSWKVAWPGRKGAPVSTAPGRRRLNHVSEPHASTVLRGSRPSFSDTNKQRSLFAFMKIIPAPSPQTWIPTRPIPNRHTRQWWAIKPTKALCRSLRDKEEVSTEVLTLD